MKPQNITYMSVEMTVYIKWGYGREVEDISIYIGTQDCTELTEQFHSEIIDECIRSEEDANCDVEAFLT